MAAVASPSKQLKMDPPVIPQQAPDDPRGRFAKVASQHDHVLDIQKRAREIREAVARGQAGASTVPASRQLGPTRSEPNLIFGRPQPPRGLANSHQEIMDTVHSSGGSRREIQPMYQTGSPTSSIGAGGQLQSRGDGYYARVATIEAGMRDDGDDDADGFDVDDVFGSPNKILNFDNPESQLDGASTSTFAPGSGTGAGLKRAFTEDEKEDAEEDEEMALTDVEDEGEGVAPLGNGRQLFANPSRSGLARTQSLPAAVFNGAEDF